MPFHFSSPTLPSPNLQCGHHKDELFRWTDVHPNTDVAAVLATLSALVDLAERLELPQLSSQQQKYRDRYIEEEDGEDRLDCGNPGANFPDLVPREEAARAAGTASTTFLLGHVDSMTGVRSERARRLESFLLLLLLVSCAVILHLFPPAPYFE